MSVIIYQYKGTPMLSGLL